MCGQRRALGWIVGIDCFGGMGPGFHEQCLARNGSRPFIDLGVDHSVETTQQSRTIFRGRKCPVGIPGFHILVPIILGHGVYLLNRIQNNIAIKNN